MKKKHSQTDGDPITPRLMGLNDAARYTGLSYWSLYWLVKQGSIPTIHVPSGKARDGRVSRRILMERSALDAFIDECKRNSV